jgi:putative phage-type endonuclease
MLENSLIHLVDYVQGEQAWLDFRKGKIGSSMAASIVGKGFKTPLQLFEDIMEDKETPVNDAMRRGTAMEPIARQWLNDKYGIALHPVVVQHPKYSWHISSLDGLYQSPIDGTIFVAEIKCPGRVDHNLALDGIIPEKYKPQLMHILEDLPSVRRILYVSYHEDSQAEIWFYRNEEELTKQLVAEIDFFDRLISCNPPDPTEKDWVEFFAPEILSKADMYSSLTGQITKLQEKAAILKQELIEDTCSTSRSKIGDLKIQKVIRNGNIDYSKIEELKGVNLEPYRKDPIISWRITK